jgi:hypothetical protein
MLETMKKGNKVFANLIIYLFLVAGAYSLLEAYFAYKELKETKEEKEIIKEHKVCPADLRESEKEKKISSVMKFDDSAEIIKREVKEDGYLYIKTKTTNKKQLKSKQTMYLFGGIMLIMMFLFFNNFHSSDMTNDKIENDTKTVTIEDAKTYGYTVCEDVVKQYLKAPASADFPWLPINANKIDNNLYSVTSYVDAQNGFGAKIRTYFVCKVKYDDVDDVWTVTKVDFLTK